MESLLHWDTALMHWINAGWSNGFFDWLMPALRNKYLWIPLYTFMLAWIFYNFTTRQGWWVVFFLILSIFASDTISSKLIKNNVRRPRPCQELVMSPPVVKRVDCGSGFSFTSSHATNHFCAAAFFVILFGKRMGRWRHAWWIWAALISIAQVYVGVHYPVDIICGGLLGTIVGYSMAILCRQKVWNPENSLPS